MYDFLVGRGPVQIKLIKQWAQEVLIREANFFW